jgi:hypothetical protein
MLATFLGMFLGCLLGEVILRRWRPRGEGL